MAQKLAHSLAHSGGMAATRSVTFVLYRIGRIVGVVVMNALLVCIAYLIDAVSVIGAPWSTDPDGEVTMRFGLSFLATLPIALSLLWRNRAPGIVLGIQGLGVAVFGTSGVGAVLVLPTIIAQQMPHGQRTRISQRMRISLGVIASCAITGIGLWMEWQKPLPDRIFMSQDSATGEYWGMAWWGYLIVGAIMVTLAAAWGLVRRFRSVSAAAQAHAAQESARAHVLHSEVSRQQERELIASEMHDTVAHQLSLVALHAGALQVTTSDPNVVENARAIRRLGHQALEEMRVLISSLRDSDAGGYIGAVPTLSNLPDLVREAQEAGVKLDAVLGISGEELASDGLTRAVYRITQEALTNAIKYGTGEWVRLIVDVQVGEWVLIDVSNPIPPASAERPVTAGMGAGIPGMEQRALTLGGRLMVGPKVLAPFPANPAWQMTDSPETSGQDVWVVRAELPWSGK